MLGGAEHGGVECAPQHFAASRDAAFPASGSAVVVERGKADEAGRLFVACLPRPGHPGEDGCRDELAHADDPAHAVRFFTEPGGVPDDAGYVLLQLLYTPVKLSGAGPGVAGQRVCRWPWPGHFSRRSAAVQACTCVGQPAAKPLVPGFSLASLLKTATLSHWRQWTPGFALQIIDSYVIGSVVGFHLWFLLGLRAQRPGQFSELQLKRGKCPCSQQKRDRRKMAYFD